MNYFFKYEYDFNLNMNSGPHVIVSNILLESQEMFKATTFKAIQCSILRLTTTALEQRKDIAKFSGKNLHQQLQIHSKSELEPPLMELLAQNL